MDVIRKHHFQHADLEIEAELIHVRVHGTIEPHQIPEILHLMMQIREQQGQVFVLVDLKGAESMLPATRRLLSQRLMTEVLPTAMAVYGGRLEQRAAHAMLMGAVAGLSGRRPNTAYFPTEAEARVWIASERASQHLQS